LTAEAEVLDESASQRVAPPILGTARL